jgi:hypothetical protein
MSAFSNLRRPAIAAMTVVNFLKFSARHLTGLPKRG